jgi:hypothetical protein
MKEMKLYGPFSLHLFSKFIEKLSHLDKKFKLTSLPLSRYHLDANHQKPVNMNQYVNLDALLRINEVVGVVIVLSLST